MAPSSKSRSAGAVLTVEQMAAAERAAMDAGVSEWELMQRAGEGAARWVARMSGGRTVGVLCGPGNNGGDGYVIADYLQRSGISVSVVAPKPPATDTAKRAQDNCSAAISSDGFPAAEVYVDCLFGYGLSRQVEGAFAALLEDLRHASGYKIAIDIPSSIASDSGARLGPSVEYDLTIALGAWKQAHFIMPAMAAMGEKRLVDIGLDIDNDATCLSAAPQISSPAPDAHKYRRGLLAVVAGEMPGAPLLAAEAAMRSGAGYVKLLSDHSHPDAPAELVVEGGGLTKRLSDGRISAILIGPGLGRETTGKEKLSIALATGRPMVLDADALHLLTPTTLEGCNAAHIAVTPHEGELHQLCAAFAIDAETKIDRACGLHEKTGMTVLAKGPDSILVGKEGVRFFNRGPSWLSAAGTGDVLAGIAASRLVVNGDLQLALEEAVWIHHEAARIAGAAFTAGELAQHVNLALESFL
ncbi:NAD(P)H-hydrate epimerase [Qipengyuania sp. 1XM1-15A]|uniref:NAD(P)H-hydrate epimerase n=1 Tax=Qipengyuania xiamenensis TaxID=2867237 RepID=UPI001C86BD53|nr:NAD(P)H-hydrate epimerase [Qipengyuania xiamenensis]MBX7531472.1 NAD(P)H-hydrate epimerase [Qipengyuania xiamenensis]